MNEKSLYITKQICKICGWEWWPKYPRTPKRCPKCNNNRWNIGPLSKEEFKERLRLAKANEKIESEKLE
jgi:hypothetical protein